MFKLVSLVILAGLQMGSIDLFASVHPLLQSGCACHCATDQAVFRVWQQKDGPADRFASKTIGGWLNRMLAKPETFTKTELLILLGRSAKGIWTMETWETDGEGAIYTDLVLTTNEGKRQVFPLVKGFGLESLYFSQLRDGASKVERSRRRVQVLRDLNARVMRRLSQLAKSGQWDAGSLIPVQLPLLPKPPTLVFRQKSDPCSDGNRSNNENTPRSRNRSWPNTWSLYVRAKDRRLVRIRRGGADCGDYFRGAKCFGGVTDDANGETWWILVKTAGGDSCGAEWHSIRLTHNVPVKQ